VLYNPVQRSRRAGASHGVGSSQAAEWKATENLPLGNKGVRVFKPSAALPRTTANANSFFSHALEQCKSWSLACKDLGPIACFPFLSQHPAPLPCRSPAWAEQGGRDVLWHHPCQPVDQPKWCANKPPVASILSTSHVTCSTSCNVCPGQGSSRVCTHTHNY